MVSTARLLTKRKRVSKKSKKSWRKNTEIKDVEKFLEDKLREERTGGNPAEKKSKDLFYIDKSDIFQTPKSKLASMKCHSEIQIDTVVSPVSGYTGPKKKKRKIIQKQDEGAIPIPAQNRKSGKIYDIWGSAATSQPKKQLDPCLPEPAKIPTGYKIAETKLSAVEKPHPGMSYNPTFTEHQKLLQSALDVETKREKDKAKTSRDSAPPLKITEEDYINEMSIGLSKPGQVEVNSESEGEMEPEKQGFTAAVKGRKTRVQRNKERTEKQRHEGLVAAKALKLREQECLRLRSIKKEIRKEEIESGEITAERQAKVEENRTRPGKYGPTKLIEEVPEFVLPEEVSSSLRQLANPTNNLHDRFKSMQKRNIIEVRKRVIPHRKYKIKTVEKWRAKLPEEMAELTKLKRKSKKKINLTE